jgi:hypothetical protein
MSQTTAQLVSEINGGPIAGSRNRIINGDMRIDQRNNGAAITANGYPVDRFTLSKDTAALGLSAQRVAEAPAGFTNSTKFTINTATATGASEANTLVQSIEGYNVADLNFGTASALNFTISFWVKCSTTGTFGGGLRNAAANRYRAFSYSINAANTWEYKTITIPGDTTGTWATDNSAGLIIFWSIGTGVNYSGSTSAWGTSVAVSATGATSITNTSGATWQITGVQLEPGTVATPFERRSYGQELALCQRYYQLLINVNYGGDTVSGSNMQYSLAIPQMRANPTVTETSVTSTNVAAVAFTVFGSNTLRTFLTPNGTNRYVSREMTLALSIEL